MLDDFGAYWRVDMILTIPRGVDRCLSLSLSQCYLRSCVIGGLKKYILTFEANLRLLEKVHQVLHSRNGLCFFGSFYYYCVSSKVCFRRGLSL